MKKGEEDVKFKKCDCKGFNRNVIFVYNEDGWILCIDGIDVEVEFCRMGILENEEEFDQDLYKYWLKGGWWGLKDLFGDYLLYFDEDDWDVISVIFMVMINVMNDEDGWEFEDLG